VDEERAWQALLASCALGALGSSAPQQGGRPGKAQGMDVDAAPRVPTTVSLAPRHNRQITFIPPPADRSDLLAVVEVAKCAEVRQMNRSAFVDLLFLSRYLDADRSCWGIDEVNRIQLVLLGMQNRTWSPFGSQA
jgi:hypothetical protein